MATPNKVHRHLDENRFEASKATLLIDQFMNHFIKVGGLSIITVVLGIFIFIFWQIIPLFQGAQVTETATIQIPEKEYVYLGSDEYLEIIYTVDQSGEVGLHRLTENGQASSQLIPLQFTSESTLPAVVESVSEAVVEAQPPKSPQVTAISPTHNPYVFAVGTADGKAGILEIQIKPVFDDQGNRTMETSVGKVELFQVGLPGQPVTRVAYGDAKERRILSTYQSSGDSRGTLRIGTFAQQQTLFGAGELEFGGVTDVSQYLPEGEVLFMHSNRVADAVVLGDSDGTVSYIFGSGDEFSLRQSFRPFENYSDQKIASMNFLFGEVSLIVTNPSGENLVYSLYVPEGANERIFGLTKTFPALTTGGEFYSASERNKSYVIGAGSYVSLRYATTERVLWEKSVSEPIRQAFITPKYDHILMLGESSKVLVYELDDPHPNGGWKALFGKVWYEGSPKPTYTWQSTGGTDDFEPKLSLIPLIIGTLKGTLYAMLFAVPIALMAAVYVSQFTIQKVKQIVKPTMEIMASLPSVVLGFLAALWLAPLIEDRVPSVMLTLIVIPVAAFLSGMAWLRTPTRWRNWMGRGNEWWVFVPLLILLALACWHLGPLLEQMIFVYQDPVTGERIADFRMWWPHVTGTDFQQRNSLVVGFVMGFAVIPIIFTIAEDSLSNVPGTMTAGSLALGASRWQTAMRIILPTASAGIFSALMIGLGRAVGETMIVVMATGNTPIMDLNIFSGMRTLSANIAVELPEAPHHGTLYRAIFLGAMALFLMTFVVNTVAEILRQHLREKYKTV